MLRFPLKCKKLWSFGRAECQDFVGGTQARARARARALALARSRSRSRARIGALEGQNVKISLEIYGFWKLSRGRMWRFRWECVYFGVLKGRML